MTTPRTNAARDLSDNAGDIGTVEGVLGGLLLTANLLPHHQEAITVARAAIERIRERNRRAVECIVKQVGE